MRTVQLLDGNSHDSVYTIRHNPFGLMNFPSPNVAWWDELVTLPLSAAVAVWQRGH
jgi:hypothetical protein